MCSSDLRMGEVYHAAYERTADDWREVCAPGLYKPEAVPALQGEGWTGCGSGFAVFLTQLMARYAGQVANVIDGLAPHAREVAAIAARRFARDESVDPADALPLYVRNKVALKVSER